MFYRIVWDEDARQLDEVSTKWSADDPESSIAFCEWAIGKHRHDCIIVTKLYFYNYVCYNLKQNVCLNHYPEAN